MRRLILVPLFLVIVLAMVTPNTQAANGKHGLMAKVGFALASLYNEHGAYVAREGRDKGFKPSNILLPVIGNRVVIDAVARGNPDALKSDLKGLGLQKVSRFGRVLSGQLPIGAIKGMAGLSSLEFARPAYATTRAGLVTSQGDAAMRSDDARTFGVNGAGITVGVLSDSFNCLGGAADDVASGDLPAGINVLKDEMGCRSGSDEGRAMMQLIHDVAPGAAQVFHTAFDGHADFAQGIQELANNGADVIVDDVIYFAEPMFQDGIIAQAVDNVVAEGVAYFSSAGNQSRNSYQEPFFPSIYVPPDSFISLPGAPPFYGGYIHNFGGDIVSQEIIIPAGVTVIIVYQWNDPFYSVCGTTGCFGADTDMDMYLLDESGFFILAGGVDENIGGDPVEILGVVNSGESDVLVNLILVKYAGPEPELMKYVRFGGVLNLGQEGSGTIYGHANAAGAEAVGAAFYVESPEFGQDPPLLEPYSSAGPTPILFETDGTPTFEERKKPGIVAPDCTNTTFFYPTVDLEPDGWPNFCGTSGAAPHAAAVAALLLEANPSLSPDGIYAVLESTAIDMMKDPGFDFDSGFGFIQADAAVGMVLTPNLPPNANFTFTTEGLTANFTDTGTDSDGSVVAWNWNFGDGNGATSQNTIHTYAASGTYSVTLTVTDDDGATGFTSQDVRVSDSSGVITLTATGTTVRAHQMVDLEWSGATSNKVDIYLNDNIIVTTKNDGLYTDRIGKSNGGGSYTYRVCEQGSISTCSDEASVNF